MANDTDIFGYKRAPKPQNVFSNSGAIMTFGGDTNQNGPGNLIQNWNVTYNNNITEIFELGSPNIYWVQGRPTGTASVARIIGLGNVKLLPDNAYDICKGGALLRITAKPGACPGEKLKELKLELSGCIVTSIGFDAAVADTRINESINWRFSTLRLV